jgi:hypothetical protein
MTSHHTHDEDRLREALRTQAHRGAPSPVGVDEVTTRARRIRRRRTTVAALSTAAVVALVVPLGVAISGTSGSPDEPPVAEKPAIEPPAQWMEVPLLKDVPTGGEPPSMAYLRGDDIITPDGDEVAVPGNGTPTSLIALGDVWLVGKTFDEGPSSLDTVDSKGRLVDSLPMSNGPVVSDDGTVAAYVDADNNVHSITADDGDEVLAPASSFSSPVVVVGVVGSQSCKDKSNVLGGCKVAVNLGDGSARYATSRGDVHDVPGYRNVSDLFENGVLGMVSISDFGSCSALERNGERVWRTCDNSFKQVSPDERYAIGMPPYYDGLGSRSFSIVDMANGRERVRFADTGTSATYVRQVVWESDTSVLATLWNGEEQCWGLVRARLDGSLTEIECVPGSDMEPAVQLAPR